VFYGGPASSGRLAKELWSETAALPSTGVYWIPLYEILEERGFEVYLVHCTAQPEPAGTQEQRAEEPERQWLLKLHT
jgi:transposase